jgi:UDPglucose 6-dehydrogenase
VRRIAVCGLGKLGSPIAAAFAMSGLQVIGLDVDREKVRSVNMHCPPVEETDLAAYLELSETKKNLRATCSSEDAVRASQACLFVAPTPSLADGSFDHGPLIAAVESVAREVRRQHVCNYLFVINSTVMPGTCEKEIAPMLRKILEAMPFLLAYKPEFIALGTVIQNLHYPDFVLIGQSCVDAGTQVEGLYRKMIVPRVPFRTMTLTEAELAKISLNCAVTMKISFANQVAAVASALGVNAHRVLEAVGDDKRIGPGALLPGLPYGGPCFPRDNRMFQRVADSLGVSSLLARATDQINEVTLKRIYERVVTEAPGTVGILGQAYKPGTTVTEASPGALLAARLSQLGLEVWTHDPKAIHSHTLEEVMRCGTIVVATACEEYRGLLFSSTTRLIDPMKVVQNPDVRLESNTAVEVTR